MINNEIGKITDNGIVEKEYFGQGFIYKNYNNFKDKKGICYISEYQADKITKIALREKITKLIKVCMKQQKECLKI